MTQPRVERHQRTASRLAVRAIVVGGFAGAAWLLSAPAAHAAPVESVGRTAPTDLSVVNLVGGIGNDLLGGNASARDAKPAALKPVADTVGTATQPLLGATSTLLGGEVFSSTSVVLPSTTARKASPIAKAGRHGRPGSVVRGRVPAAGRVLVGAPTGSTVDSAPAVGVPPMDRVTDGDRTRGGTGLAQFIAGVFAPLGLADVATAPLRMLAPLRDVLDPAFGPVAAALRPFADALLFAVAPMATTLRTVTRSDAGASVWPSSPARSGAASIREGTAAPHAKARHETVRHHAVPAEPSAVVRTTVDRGAPHAPVLPQPAPLQAYLGISGACALGAGAQSEGGTFGVVSGWLTGGSAADRRLPVAADVAVHGAYAGAPTVSPD